MANFFAELKQRQMFRVAAAYAVVAWLLLQLFNNVAPILESPPWVARTVLLLLALGFPSTLIFAWVRELAPADGATAGAATTKLDYVLIGALVVVIALVSYQQLAPSPGAGTTPQQAGVTSGALGAAGISIAVLPLVNLSDDRQQEFFSDGMTDEIASALAKVRDLRVVGRSSAFQFKGQSKDLRAIGKALSALYLIDGSVRRAGDRVRITAQLVEANSGVQLWSENYDRELEDVFAVQEEIAQAIAASLRVPLGLRQGESLVPSRTANIESYQDFLRAKALVRARGLSEPGGPLTEAATLLEQVVARDPNYGPAWALLAQAYGLTPANSLASTNSAVDELRRIVAATAPKAEAAAQQSIRLEPNNADGYAALAIVQNFRGRYVEAEDLFKQALSLDPGNPEALQVYSNMLTSVGRLKDALPLRQRLRALEPFVPVFNMGTARALLLNGQNDEAIALLEALPADSVYPFFAEIYASMGRYREAVDSLLAIPSGIYLPGAVEEAARLLRTAPAQLAPPQAGPRLGTLGFVYLYVGAPDRVLEVYEDGVEAGYLENRHAILWHASYAPVRKTERFKAFVRKNGTLDYWRERGWPEFCRPVGADDFVCD